MGKAERRGGEPFSTAILMAYAVGDNGCCCIWCKMFDCGCAFVYFPFLSVDE